MTPRALIQALWTRGRRARSATAKGAGLALVIGLLSACAVRYPYSEFDSSWYEGRVEHGGFLPPLEVALMTNDIDFGPSAFVLSLEGFIQGLDPSVLPPMEDWQGVDVASLMVGGRLYPFTWGPILPYGGGGFGRSGLSAEWIEYTGGGFDPLFQCILNCNDTEEKSGSLQSGYHSYLAAGVEVRPPFLRPSILLEYRRDFGRGDDFYELSGRSWSVGLRFRTGG